MYDNFDQSIFKKIKINEQFSFHCTQCGECCRQMDIILSPRDMFQIAKELQMTPHGILIKYAESYIGNASRIPIVRLRSVGLLKECSLLKDNKCIVHRAKPDVCALYPLGRIAEKGAKCIEYIINTSYCADRSKTYTVREWLRMFGIDQQDQFFIDWRMTVLDLMQILSKIERCLDGASMQLLWSCINMLLYLDYDMEKSFYPQYQTNVSKMIEILDELNSMIGNGSLGPLFARNMQKEKEIE